MNVQDRRELQGALRWLLGVDDISDAATLPAEPARTPLVELRRSGCRCSLGAVYATPHGLVFYGVLHGRVGRSTSSAPVRSKTLRAALIQHADRSDADVDFIPAACKHGQVEDAAVDLPAVLALVEKVRRGETKMPATLVAN